MDAFSASQRQEENQGRPQLQESESESETKPDDNDGRGNDQRAANYLNQAVQTTDQSKGMRMETYSELKEQEKRNQKVCSVTSITAMSQPAIVCAFLMQLATGISRRLVNVYTNNIQQQTVDDFPFVELVVVPCWAFLIEQLRHVSAAVGQTSLRQLTQCDCCRCCIGGHHLCRQGSQLCALYEYPCMASALHPFLGCSLCPRMK